MASDIFGDPLPDAPPPDGPGLFGDAPPPAAPAEAAKPYRVLARKYRPQNFAELIGQDALVRTLGNAFAQGRVHHAFMLTGVRGVGKTTTARIIARALNCIGPDGKGGPTADPCGVCAECRAILADRRGQATAEVTSAAPLSDSQRMSLEGSLKKTIGRNVDILSRVDPSILGGLIVRVGSRMVDSSLRSKLQRLKLAMKGVG